LFDKIFVDTFVKELGDDKGGMSRPIHIIGSNQLDYILKTQHVYDPIQKDWVNWDSMFLHEVLVYNIANYLGVPIPDCAIVNVEKIFLDHAPSLVFAHRYTPGNHFASHIIPGVENNLKQGYIDLIKLKKPYIKTSWRHFVNGITNKDDIPKIVVLDLLTANFDRFGNDGNLLIASQNGDRKMYAIDHGHCFYGPIWSNITKRENMRKAGNNSEYISTWVGALMANTGHIVPMGGLGVMFQAIGQYIDVSDPNNHCFKDIVSKVEAINEKKIDTWFVDIPDEWFVDKKAQIATYKHFLLNQKELLRKFIKIMADNGAFDSYLGGDLKWNEKPTGTQ
jgi:hypothetical protein